MSEAEIIGAAVLALAAILGLFFTVGKPIIDLNRTITKLETTVDGISSKLGSFETRNTEAHRRIWNKNEEQDGILNDHEVRISGLEQKSRNCP